MVAEKHIRPQMDLDGNRTLSWFFREWVYGTAVPRYKFDSTVTPTADGRWQLTIDSINVTLPQKPRKVMINANRDVLEL